MNESHKVFKSQKVLIIAILLIGLIFPFAYRIVKYYSDYDFTIESYIMDVTVSEEGDLHVVERITNKYKEQNTVFYKNLVYGKNNTFSKSEDVSMLDKSSLSLRVESNNETVFDSKTDVNTQSHFIAFSGDRDERGMLIGCEDNQDDCEMIFYYNKNGIDRETTFIYEYSIIGAVTSYGDVSELNWKFLGEQPMKVNNIEVNVHFPDVEFDKDFYKAYGYGNSVGDFEYTSNNTLKIEVPDILKGEFVEMRILLPNEMFPGIRSQNKVNTLQYDLFIDASEEALAYSKRLVTIQTISYISVLILLLMFAAAAYYAYSRYGKKHKSDFYGEYYRELPAEYGPALLGNLYRFGKITDNDLAATLLDLIRRKYLILDDNNEGVNAKEPNFIIKLNKDRKTDDLEDHEEYLIKWFINEIGNGTQVELKELKEYVKEEHQANKYRISNTTWNMKVKQEASKQDFFDLETIKVRPKLAMFSTLGFLFAVIFFVVYLLYKIDSTIIVLSMTLATTVAYLVYVNTLTRRSIKGNEDYVRWVAFKKFLEDFSTFKDYPVPSLVIWEHYLVYATSFGIADKVMDQLKLKFSESDFTNANLTYGRYFSNNFFINMYFINSLSRLRVNAVTTIAAAKSARVAKSGGGRIGGGGFGGGSSFGGGGGSFGGR